MLRCLEHLIPAVARFRGQFIAFHVVPTANVKLALLPQNSLWVPVLTIVVGLVLWFRLLMSSIGFILLADKLGLIDLKEYKRKHSGFR